MREFLILAGSVAPIFAIITAGLLLRRFNWLTEDADQSLLKIVINLLIPALILASILGNETLRQPGNLIVPPVVGFGAATADIAFGWLVAQWSGAATRAERASFAMAAGLQNYLYYALPLIVLLYDPGTVGVLFVHNVGVDVVLWTIVVAALSATGLLNSWRGLVNSPIVALVCAVGLNLAEPHAAWLTHLLAPAGVLLTTARTLGQCATPLALLLTGAVIGDHLADLRRPSPRLVGAALLVRFGFAPVLYLALARFLPCSVELKRVLVVQGTMPSSMFTILMTRRYGGDSRIAVQVVLATTIASLAMVPLWLALARLFVPL